MKKNKFNLLNDLSQKMSHTVRFTKEYGVQSSTVRLFNQNRAQGGQLKSSVKKLN